MIIRNKLLEKNIFSVFEIEKLFGKNY